MKGQSHLVLEHDLPEDVAALVGSAPRVAWDIETTSLNWAEGRIATCQLATPDIMAIVQLRGPSVPARLTRLLADARVMKVFHHAPFDLRFMSWCWHVRPQRVACTKIASKILDPAIPAEGHSLRQVLMRHLGIEIDKGQRTSDWARPTLTNEQIAYAGNDVIHLLTLYEKLEEKVSSAGRKDLLLATYDYLPTRVQLDLMGAGDVYLY